MRAILQLPLLLLLCSVSSALFAAELRQSVYAIQRGEYVAAADVLKMLADRGNPMAQYQLGRLYEAGKGVARSPDDAARLYLAAALQGLPPAQGDYARLLLDGIGVERNLDLSIKWYGLAAAAGEAISQWAIAMLYYRGDGVGQDLNTALSWALKSAEQQYPPAQHLVGTMLLNGAGVPRDRKLGQKWLSQAAEQGDARAAAALGLSHLDGGSRREACFWFRVSTTAGLQNEFDKRRLLEEKDKACGSLSRAESLELDQRLRRWTPTKRWELVQQAQLDRLIDAYDK